MKPEAIEPKLHLLLIAIQSYQEIVGGHPTQAILAEELCVSESTIGDWMNKLKHLKFISQDKKGGAIKILKLSRPNNDIAGLIESINIQERISVKLNKCMNELMKSCGRLSMRISKLERGK